MLEEYRKQRSDSVSTSAAYIFGCGLAVTRSILVQLPRICAAECFPEYPESKCIECFGEGPRSSSVSKSNEEGAEGRRSLIGVRRNA